MANRREMYDLTDQTLTTTDRREKRVTCPENEELASFMWKKRQEFVESKKLSERIDSTLYKAYSNVCSAKSPIATAKDFLEIKGVGKWVVRLMKDFFKQNDSSGGASDPEDLPQIGKKKTRRYLPQKSSASYALLITLHRGTTNGKDFMRKQELIDATEASGLARVPIAPELGKGRPGHSGSKSDWYSGWSGMTKLITKGLVVKSSNPAKYMLTQEGREAANECISRSGLVDSVGPGSSGMVERSISEVLDDSDLEIGCIHLADEGTRQFVGLSSHRKSFGVPNGVQSVDLSSRRKSIDVPNGVIEKFTYMGYSLEQIRNAFAKVPPDTRSKDDSSLLPAILHHLQKDQVDVLLSECRQAIGIKSLATANISDAKNVDSKISCEVAEDGPDCSSSAGSMQSSFTLKGCSSSDYAVHKSLNHDGLDAKANAFMLPPLRFGERFKDAYDVILILDNREQFTRNKGSRSRKLVEHICSEFKIQIEVRCLPVGDGIWIARHKDLGTEYVLDFIVERKEVDDLRCSIRDNRYRDQKLRLLRCGLQKLIFLVEGDPNSSEAAESIKTACFTTEILEGFDVQRTSGLGDTLRKYGYLTSAITNCYRESDFSHSIKNVRICPSFDEFIRKCQDLEKMTVGDIFAIQLMQVSQVTEDVALAVLDMYPTLISLAHAYAYLEGDTCAQEEMLKKQSNNFISGVASKNIFQLVWGGSRIANV